MRGSASSGDLTGRLREKLQHLQHEDSRKYLLDQNKENLDQTGALLTERPSKPKRPVMTDKTNFIKNCPAQLKRPQTSMIAKTLADQVRKDKPK